MSEYQYYEFAALDRPISDAGFKYARGCSTRANVSRVRWQNTYTFGDFHGSVDTLLKYYDAHFYLANWGMVRLGLAFPPNTFAPKAIRPYLRTGERVERTLSVKETVDRYVIWWERNDDSGGEWIEGEGIIDQLVGIREELMRGDYRSLFLGWLADFYPDDWLDSEGGQETVPPIPAGLANLSPSQEALVETFCIDRNTLAAAAELSGASETNRIPIATIIEKYSLSELRALLTRVAEGGGAGVMAELNRLTYLKEQIPVNQRMKCAEFAARAVEAGKALQKRKAEAAESERQRKMALRRKHLGAVILQAETKWSALTPLMDRRIASAYDQVADQLRELRDAYAQAGDMTTFQQKLAEFRHRYSTSKAMLRRIENISISGAVY